MIVQAKSAGSLWNFLDLLIIWRENSRHSGNLLGGMMKKVWIGILVLGAVALLPTKTQADVSETCANASSCSGSCHYIAWVQYTDPDGNTGGYFGGCCWCT